MEDFLKSLQESALPAIWSRGVALTREASFILDSSSGPELIVRVLLKNRPVHPRVTLWPTEGDAYCDCGDRNDPCLHIVAAALAVKSGQATQAGTSAHDKAGEAEKKPIGVSYRLLRKERNLELERWIGSLSGEIKLEESLVGFIGGIQSGRIHHPAVATTRDDFAIDALLSHRSSRSLDRPAWAKILALLENAPHLLLDGKPVKASGAIFPLKLELIDDAGGFRLRRKTESSVREVFLQGIVRAADSADATGILRPAQDPDLDARERDWIKGEGSFFADSDQARLVSEILPTLELKLPVEIVTEKLPRLVDFPPRIALEIEPEGRDAISVLADLVYGDPPIARVRLDLTGAPLESISRGQIPRRDPALEKTLVRDLQTERHLKTGQRVRMEGDEAARFLLKQPKNGDYPTVTALDLAPKFSIEGQSEFNLNFSFEDSQNEVLSGQAVLAAWKAGRSFFPLSSGGWAPLPQDWLARYGGADFECARCSSRIRGKNPEVAAARNSRSRRGAGAKVPGRPDAAQNRASENRDHPRYETSRRSEV
jgi:hypothetical protein